jgi:L-aminopeptidase/D-esterase-like protein
MGRAMKGGLGLASLEVHPGLSLGAIAAVNPVGDVLDRPGGRILAGTRLRPGERALADSVAVLRELSAEGASPRDETPAPENTILVVVATNARMGKEDARALARAAGAGMSRVVRPAHLKGDGDLVFALAAGDQEAPIDLLGVLASDLVAEAIVCAVREARPLHGIPSVAG